MPGHTGSNGTQHRLLVGFHFFFVIRTEVRGEDRSGAHAAVAAYYGGQSLRLFCLSKLRAEYGPIRMPVNIYESGGCPQPFCVQNMGGGSLFGHPACKANAAVLYADIPRKSRGAGTVCNDGIFYKNIHACLQSVFSIGFDQEESNTN